MESYFSISSKRSWLQEAASYLNHSLVLDYGGGVEGVRMEFSFLFYFFVNFCASKSETADVTVYLGRIGSIKNVPSESVIKCHIPLSL